MDSPHSSVDSGGRSECGVYAEGRGAVPAAEEAGGRLQRDGLALLARRDAG